MSLTSFGLLKGRIHQKYFDQDTKPHLHFQVKADGEDFDVAVNVQSSQNFAVNPIPGVPPNQVLYLIDDNMSHPSLEHWLGLKSGFHSLMGETSIPSVDYIRGNFFDAARMKPLPAVAEGDNNDLFDRIGVYVDRAMRQPEARVYAFGERWPTTDKVNARFGFQPDQGVHDVHMNQGNNPEYVRDDGVWQDGALFFHFPEEDQWVGLFIAFQAQCWHTDELGHAIESQCARPGTVADQKDGRVCILAATVNPYDVDMGRETVFLLNTTPRPIDLSGWKIVDKNQRSQILEGEIAANDIRKITLSERGAQLSNRGGIISLLDAEGLKIHGVSYTRQQAGRAGYTLTF